MEESVFFNRGNALASKKDPKDLYRTVQVEQSKQRGKENLVIVVDENNQEHLLFSFDDQLPKQKGEEFKVKERI